MNSHPVWNERCHNLEQHIQQLKLAVFQQSVNRLPSPQSRNIQPCLSRMSSISPPRKQEGLPVIRKEESRDGLFQQTTGMIQTQSRINVQSKHSSLSSYPNTQLQSLARLLRRQQSVINDTNNRLKAFSVLGEELRDVKLLLTGLQAKEDILQQNKGLKDKLIFLKQEVQTLLKELKLQKQQNDAVSTQRSKIHEYNQLLRNQNVELHASHEKALKDLLVLRQKVNSLQTQSVEMPGLYQKIERMQSQWNLLSKENSGLKGQVQLLQKQLSEKGKKNMQLQQKCREFLSKLDKAQLTQGSLAKNNVALTAEIQTLRSTLHQTKKSLAKLEAQLGVLSSSKKTEADAKYLLLTTQSQTMSSQINNLQAQLQSVTEKAKAQRQDRANLQRQKNLTIKSLQHQINSLRMQLQQASSIKQSNSQLHTEISRLKSSDSMLEQSRRNKDHLFEQLQESQTRNGQLLRQILHLKEFETLYLKQRKRCQQLTSSRSLQSPSSSSLLQTQLAKANSQRARLKQEISFLSKELNELRSKKSSCSSEMQVQYQKLRCQYQALAEKVQFMEQPKPESLQAKILSLKQQTIRLKLQGKLSDLFKQKYQYVLRELNKSIEDKKELVAQADQLRAQLKKLKG